METRTTKEILIAARKLIEKKESWFGGDRFSESGDEKCALLAIADTEYSDWEQAADYLGHTVNNKKITSDRMALVNFNNTHTHAEVLAAFDKAIAEA